MTAPARPGVLLVVVVHVGVLALVPLRILLGLGRYLVAGHVALGWLAVARLAKPRAHASHQSHGVLPGWKWSHAVLALRDRPRRWNGEKVRPPAPQPPVPAEA